MIEIINENILHSGADIIINPVDYSMDCSGGIYSKMNSLIGEEMPWVKTEYRKYIRKHNKEQHKILGTVQFVPTEVWAVGLTDTMKTNNQITMYGNDFAYVANIFVKENTPNYAYEVESVLNSMGTVYERTCQNGIKSIAIPADFISHTSEEFCEELIAKWSAANIEVKFYKVI